MQLIVFIPKPVLSGLSGLDPVISDSIDRLILRVCEHLKVTSVVVTHDMRSMRRVGQRVFFLHQGRIHTTGTPEGLFQSTDPLVHRFVNGISTPETLTNLSGLVENFNRISGQSLATLDSLNQFVETNTQPLNAAVANLEAFSGQLNTVATELHHMVATNRTDIRDAIQSIESATHQISLLSSDLQDGKGIVGSLLKNETLKEDFLETLHNLGSLSSNLSRHGLLWKPRLPKPPSSTAVYTGRNPLR